MNGLNQIIAQGGRQLQLESPLNQLAQVETIRQAQQTNALRQAEMQQLQQEQARTRQTREALARPGVVSPTGQISREKALEGLPGDLSFEVAKQIDEFQASDYKNLSAKAKAIADMTGTYEDQLARAPDLQSFINVSLQMLEDPTYGEFLANSGSTRDGVMQNIQQVMAQNPQNGLDVLKRRAVSGADTVRQSLVDRGTPSPLGKLQDERQTLIDAGVGPNDQRVRELNQRILKETTPAGPSTVVLTGTQEKQFEGELGKLQAKELMDSRKEAEDARAIIDTVNTGRELLNEGTLVGAGADFLVGFNNALSRAGLDFGYNDAAKNTQAYAAAIGNNVGRIISLFGAGTGLSDADREFAKLIAGGNIQVTEAALRRILDINERAARGVIALHNERAQGVKTNIPLVVDMPQFNIPDQAVNFLRQNNTPANRRFFDQKYGKSAAKSILGE
jgi:hypothetical protein